MNGRSFVDTNILVYSHDSSAGDKHVRARDTVERLWMDRSGVLSTQVLQELYVSLKKARGALSTDQAREIVSDYLRWDVVVNTGDSILQAIDIESRHRLSFWDALIVQAAASAGCALLYSEDLSHGRVYEGVRVIDPLRA